MKAKCSVTMLHQRYSVIGINFRIFNSISTHTFLAKWNITYGYNNTIVINKQIYSVVAVVLEVFKLSSVSDFLIWVQQHFCLLCVEVCDILLYHCTVSISWKSPSSFGGLGNNVCTLYKCNTKRDYVYAIQWILDLIHSQEKCHVWRCHLRLCGCVVFLPESLFEFRVYKIGLLYNRSSYFVCDCWQVRQFPKFVQSLLDKRNCSKRSILL